MPRREIPLPDLIEGVRSGDRRALARALTHVENDHPNKLPLLEALYPDGAGTHIIGVTGAPGTGKSTLVNQMARHLRQQEKTVAVLAVDPTSPFSGGAILGDRIRMRDLAGDPGVFIRSMASRGSLGGLASATHDLTTIMAAAPFDRIIVETVGAGQSETEIATLAHTVLVVEAPGLGDDIQALKAGILEIADILVVNKSDDPRAASTMRALQAMRDLGHPPDRHHHHHHDVLLTATQPDPAPSTGWETPIQLTNALASEGITDLLDSIDAHYQTLTESGAFDKRVTVTAALTISAILQDRLLANLLEAAGPQAVREMIEQVAARQQTPHGAAQKLIDKF